MKTTFKHTDKSVRDLPQQAVISIEDDTITVNSKVGKNKKTVTSYQFPLKDYLAVMIADAVDPSPLLSYQSQFIYEKTKHYDDEPGGECQAERIRESQIKAINVVIIKMQLSFEMAEIKGD